MESLARRLGCRVFEETSTSGMSRPMTVIEGWAHSREASVPVPLRSVPGSTPESSRTVDSS
ncbi:Uncharacterised protein [Mycobacteroides abscessus subsp. abscessus]|nr:Uncharacterised protein [Mycobacteroides abscessus subsp. abscessus]